MKLSVGHKVSALALAATALLLTFVALVHAGFRQVNAQGAEVVTMTAALHHHDEADMMHDAMRADVLAAFLAAKDKSAEGLAEAQKDRAEHEKTFREAFAANRALPLSPAVKTALEEVSAPLEAYIAAAAQIITLSGKDLPAAEAAMPKFRQAFTALEKSLGDVSDKIQAEADSVNKDSTEATARFSRQLWWGAGGAVALLGILAFLVTRSIPRPFLAIIERVAQSVEANAASASQISQSSSTLAEQASEQAAALEQTSASLEEISGMAKQNEAGAQRAKDSTREAREAAQAGTREVDAMNEAMAAIQSSSEGIAKIIKTIDEIAFQTNILALNAAVEAARAGSAGVGFAVVAEEVRALAQRSAAAARETAEKIEDSVQKSRHGAHVCGQVAAELRQIALKTQEVDELVAEITRASQDQASGITQLNDAVGQMDRSVQSNAATAEETASVAEELAGQSAALRETVKELEQAVGGHGSKAGAFKASPLRMPPSSSRTAGLRKPMINKGYRPTIGRSGATVARLQD